MAILSNKEAFELMKSPLNGGSLRKAVKHEQQVRVHTEAVQDVEDEHNGHIDFKGWVRSVLNNNEKYVRFLQMLTYPYSTNELSEYIYSKLSKVFDSRNSYRKYKFKNPEDEIKFLEYLDETNDSFFWRNDVWDTIQHYINSVIVIDLQSNINEVSKPYSFIFKTEQIIDIKNTKSITTLRDEKKQVSYRCEYLIARNGNSIYVYDDESYRRYDNPKNDNSSNWLPTSDVPTIQSPHSLGYTPAKQIWSTPFNSKDTIRKSGLMSKVIGDLNKLLYHIVGKENLQNYIINPVIVEYETECDYVADNGNRCEGGWIHNTSNYDNTKYERVKCPQCASDLVGPGSRKLIEPPQEKDEFDQAANAISFIQPPLAGLQEQQLDVERRKKIIEAKVTGVKEGSVDQAKNELQIFSQLLTENQMLRNIGVNLEIIQKFDHDTKARLMFDSFEGSTIFWGDEFLLKSTQELIEGYKTEKESGSPEFELKLSRDKITESKHKHNPNLLNRIKILSQVEPFQGQTLAEVTTKKKELGVLIGDVQYVIKVNFDTFVNRYEREEKPIESLLMEKNSIVAAANEIDKKFKEYAEELILDTQTRLKATLEILGKPNN